MTRLTHKNPIKIKTVVVKEVVIKEVEVIKEVPQKRNPYKIEIFKDKSGKPRWRLVSTNGNILATSEAYERKTTRTKIAKNLANGLGLDGLVESDNTKLL